MDFDPRITSDGKGYGAAYGVHCNFHYGRVHDVYDEDAKNEDACVQTLRHLIAKADADIADLKDELAILQCQRKWAESDELSNPFEVCCATFKRKIDFLTSAIQKSRNGVDTSDIPRPTDRIHDIIDALFSSNIKEPNEQSQKGDLFDEMDLIDSSGLLNIDEDGKHDATTLDLSLEEEQMSLLESLAKLGEQFDQTVSEESFSDAARYSIKELADALSVGSSDEVAENVGSAEHASGDKTDISTSVETLDSQSPLQASNNKGNSKPTASQPAEIESCMGDIKPIESISSMFTALTKAMVKTEQDCPHDADIPHKSTTNTLSRVQNDGAKDSAEAHPEAQEAQACVPDLQVTYSRKKSGASQSTKPQKTTSKRKSSSIENAGQSSSPSSDIERGLESLPKTDRGKELGTEENTASRYHFRISQPKTKHSKHQVPKGSLVPTESVTPNSASRSMPRLNSLNPEQIKDSPVPSLAGAVTLTPGSSRSTAKKAKSELPFADLEGLKKIISEEPNYLQKQYVPDLRQIAKLCMSCGLVFPGCSKATKATLVERLSKFLATQ